MTRDIIGILALAGVLGCSAPSDPETGAGRWLFLSHATPPRSFMEALYRGRVFLDSSGCFRLQDTPDHHTVIWPFGSRVVELAGVLVVLDGQGGSLGPIGGSFGLGGGEVPQEMGLAFLAPELVDPARTRCPGRYWVVGEVVR